MLKDTIDKVLGNFTNKKLIEYLVIFAVIGVILVITANSLWGGSEKTEKQVVELPVQAEQNNSSDPNAKLEKKVAQILSSIQGVGRVSVVITYLSGPEFVPAIDSKENRSDTNEKDTDGGERRITQNERDNKLVYTEEQSGTKKPIILKQLTSKVMGVVVSADGGGDIVVKTNIIRAVEALTGVSAYRIQVFKRL